jgi:peptidoglycan/LPS O-acetylase OafA/YrhL
MGTLRFLLALCVVVAHWPGSKLFGHTLMSGITAVQGFYIVSGFLITLVLNTRPEYRNIGSFYLSRYLRLWPAYAVVCVLVLLMKSDVLARGLAQLQWPAALFVIASNATIFLQDLFPFLAISSEGSIYPTPDFYAAPGPQLSGLLLVPQAWSLGVELSFYAIAPLFCRSPWRLLCLFGVGLIARLALGFWSPEIDPWSYRFAPAEMALFAIGGLGYFAGRWLERAAPTASVRIAGHLCLLALIVLIVAPAKGQLHFTQLTFLRNQTVLILIAASCPLLLIVSRGRKWDSLIGELSYPIYLSHVMIYGALEAFAPSFTRNGLVYIGATLIFSFALYWLVVRPVDRYRRRFGARVPSDFLPTMPMPEGAAAWSNRPGQ